MSESINLLNYSYDGLVSLMKQWEEPAFRAKQLVQWIHQKQATEFDEMLNLSKSLRQRLQQLACIKSLSILSEKIADDGCVKWLFALDQGNAIETVYIPEPKRGTLCVSSQVGCALNCSFCSTGKQGFNRNLSHAEIIGQLTVAKQRLAILNPQAVITNVVMMGMGEPLLNYDPVVNAMDLMMDDLAYGLSKYRVTLSTSGVIPAMIRLKADSVVALAVSLHAPNDELRNQLVPINKKYPLQQLMEVCRTYYENEPKRSVTFEYVMLKGINDSLTHAKQLIRLMQGIPAKMNLIPFNPFPGTEYLCSDRGTMEAFQERLVRSGLPTWIRRTRGQNIDGACGQLAGQFADRTGRHKRWLKTGRLVIEDVSTEECVEE